MTEHDGCAGCKHFNDNEVTHSSPCYDCIGAHKQKTLIDKYVSMTNADRIRNMSDEELAEFMFNEIRTDRECMLGDNCKKDCGCADCYLEWLQSEVKESEEDAD